jgi:bifunctional DNA-binding transcriptional regulator/antitoxin component of YhaV-PrlF toxin-antitoxin module
MYMTRIQARGTITVPLAIRERYGLETGMDIAVEACEDGTFLCIPLRRPMTLSESLERFSRPGSAPSEQEMEQQVADAIAREPW